MQKVDLHVHVDGHTDRQTIIELLKQAENQGVKCLAMVEHNNMTIYKRGGVIEDIINNEGIEAYYSGKLVAGCEYDCRVENAKISKSGKDYNGNIVHILVYTEKPVELTEDVIYDEKRVFENWVSDVKTLIELGEKLGLEMPPIEFFDYTKEHYVKQLYRYIVGDEDRKQKFMGQLLESGMTESEIEATFLNDSSFFRKLILEPNGKFFFAYKSIPSFQEVVKLAQKYNSKVVIAHPAYMNNSFNPAEYVEALMSIPRVNKEKPNIWGVEGNYMLNTNVENATMISLAKKYYLQITGGSDFQMFNNGKMYFMNGNEKLYYVPKIGFAVKSYLENNKEATIKDGNIIISDEERKLSAIKIPNLSFDLLPGLKDDFKKFNILQEEDAMSM